MYDLKPNAIYLSEKKKIEIVQEKRGLIHGLGPLHGKTNKQTIDIEMFTAANDFVFMTTN